MKIFRGERGYVGILFGRRFGYRFFGYVKTDGKRYWIFRDED